MKQNNKLNQIWYEVSGANIKMGLTRSFLDQLDECWHILPPMGRQIKMKAPLFTVETNDSLVSVLSPVAGNFLTWNDRATNFPDKLTESDVLIELTTLEVAEPAPPPQPIISDLQRQMDDLRAMTTNGALRMAVRQEARRQLDHMELLPPGTNTVRNQAVRWETGSMINTTNFTTQVRTDVFDEPVAPRGTF